MEAKEWFSPFRSLNRRGASLPLVSVDSRGFLRPEGRSCHWQVGRFSPPSRKPIGERLEERTRLASSPKGGEREGEAAPGKR